MSFLALDEIRSGFQLNQYMLLEPIGYGGQGTIWSGVDTEQMRVVALKLAPVGSEDEAAYFVELAHEAETVRRLAHPNVLPIYELGKTRTVRFLSMMYAPGGSLSDRLKRGPLDIHNCLFVASQIAAALAYVHEHRVIHRDLKPSNILTDIRSHIYLSDFGLARVMSDETKQLHTGHGTRSYSPPEQILGRAVTHRSDIYSFGVVLYELFSGNLPWNGMKSLATTQMEEGDVLPLPVQRPPEFSPELLDVLRRLTAQEQEDRPDSVEEAFGQVCEALVSSGLPRDVQQRIRTRASAVPEPGSLEREDAYDVLKESMLAARSGSGAPALSLTRFALIDSLWGREDQEALTPEQSELMWEAALQHSRSVVRWWAAIDSPQARMEACERVTGYADAGVLERVIVLMASEPDAVLRQYQVSRDSLRRLLEVGMSAPDVTLQSRTIDLIRRIPVETDRWLSYAFDETLDWRLGEMALGEGFGASETARYIGRLHSEAALRVILDDFTRQHSLRAYEALRTVAQAAGGLPSFVPLDLRLRVTAGLMWLQLTAEPSRLARGAAVAVLAGFLGLMLHFYLVITAPVYMDATRLLSALEGGLVNGPFLGMVLFLVRLLAARLSIPSRFVGFIASLAVGTVTCGMTFFAIDYLFMNGSPSFLAMAAAGLAVSLGFALAERLPWRALPIRMLLGAVGLWLGAVGSWMLYVLTGVRPMLYYIDEWSLGPVLLTAGIFAVVTSTVAGSVDLTQ